MSEKRLHIVSFDVPFPANYGGAIDVFYRIKALHEIGFEITLHCYEYGRGQAPELEQFAREVIYYSRKKSLLDWLSGKPFIVQTRRSKKLLNNLLKDDAPILFEGLHTTYFLNHPKLTDRKKLVRTHNIEHDYYFMLAEQSSGWKKRYYSTEAKKLKRYESNLKFADAILAIKQTDLDHFSHYSTEIHLLPPSFDQKELILHPTKPYLLFHGNLSVSENVEAVKWICKEIFDTLEARFIVAGKDPDPAIVELSKKGIFELKSNPDEAEMNDLVSNARVHLLYTNQSTGIKLKLINSLQTPGHVLVNPTMVEGTGLDRYCTVCLHHYEWKHEITKALDRELNQERFEIRKKLLSTKLSVIENCRIIEKILR
ncbi:MAG: hypothetical protein P8P74_13425 [Crocinitomicaceae bacterium]|nr:hypothetical protein [Crocinitomicaceae bacterium]